MKDGQPVARVIRSLKGGKGHTGQADAVTCIKPPDRVRQVKCPVDDKGIVARSVKADIALTRGLRIAKLQRRAATDRRAA